MAEYIEREAVVMGVLGLTIVDPMVAQYADAVLRQIQQATAADVVPVVHGKWSEKDNVSYDCIRMENIHWSTYVCSECAGEVFCNYAFCPNCGARMDGE